MSRFFLVLAAALLALTAVVHSALGEQQLLRPLLAQHKGITASGLARFILRFAWHLTSLTWVLLAVILLALEFSPQNALRATLAATGITFTAVGIFTLAGSRGRHVGWPMLTGIGVAALLAAVLAGT